MDLWEIGSMTASGCIQIGVLWQFIHIIKTKTSEGLSLISWYSYAIMLAYLCLFTIIKEQHWILQANYGLATILHGLTAITAHKYRKRK